ncbi:hypothetical protein C8J98_11011 [Luteibacter sp. OK325]|nr:hypothetical protein C8J98_11011 [Luteibacter sp. OK325]
MSRLIRRLMTSVASCAIGASTLLFAPQPAHAQVANFQPVSVPGCNATSLAQVPGTTDLFLGRQLINTSSDGCSGSRWSVVLLRFDWASQTFSFVKYLVAPAGNGIPLGVQSDSTITTAYDATAADVNGELWMVFECGGSGSALGPYASSCAAPISRGDYSVDLSRMNVIVSGVAASEPTTGKSASVPKIFTYQGVPYVYWSAMEFRETAGGQVVTRLATRGVQLVRDDAGMMWAAGTQRAWPADQGDEVLGSSADGKVGDLEDGFDVQVIDGRLLMTSGAGTTGCTTPLSPMFGCYHLQIRTSATPLGNHVYNAWVVNNVALPFNPHEYGRFARDPSGNWHIFGQFLPPINTGSAAPGNTVSPSQGHFPVTPSAFQFGSVDASAQPDPTSGPNYLDVPFTLLRAQNLDCQAASARLDPVGNSCASSVARYCRSQGYASGGIMEELNTVQAGVLCFRSEHVASPIVSISQLTARDAHCVAGNLFSDSCASAIAGYCKATGFAGGGFGPMEYSNDAAQVACLDGVAGNIVPTSYTEISGYNTCSASGWPGTTTCFSAVNRACLAKGYAGGYGILDHFGDGATIGCARRGVPR